MDVWSSRPELSELQNEVMTTHWEALGLQLGLKNNQLVAIRQQHLGNIADCRKDMFALWLRTKPNASSQQLLDALRTDSVAEVYMAEQYEKYIQDELSQSGTTHHAKDMSHSQGGSSVTLPHVQPYHAPRHKVSEYYRPQFDKMRGELIILVNKINRILKDNTISLDDLKSFLCHYTELRDAIEATNSIDEAINVVSDHTPIGNTHYLLTIAKNFNLQSAIVLIEEFDNSVDMFCKQIRTTHSYANFITDSSRDPQQSETVEFVLEWDAEDQRLNDIQGLLRKAFRDKAEYIQVIRKFPTKSICVICYAPPHLHEELKKLVKKNEKELREEQVLSVTIGGKDVLKRQKTETKDDEVVKDDTGIVSEQLLHLKFNFEELLILVSTLIRNEDAGKLKMHVSIFLSSEAHLSSAIKEFLQRLDSITTAVGVLNFMVRNDCVGYMNYESLKIFKRVIRSPRLDSAVQQYEQKLNALLKQFTFKTLVNLLEKHPELLPVTHIGLPKLKIHLKNPWSNKSVYSWRDFLLVRSI